MIDRARAHMPGGMPMAWMAAAVHPVPAADRGLGAGGRGARPPLPRPAVAVHLVGHPGQQSALSRLRADPALLGPAVEELLRFDSPVQLVGRVARADAVLGPLTVEAGQQVLVCLGAANRDRAAFAEPDQIRIGRAGPAHLAFGHGRHFCAGAALARLEATEILRRLLVMDPGFYTCQADVERGSSPAFRRLAHLTLRAG